MVLPDYNTPVDNLHTNIKGTVVWAMVQIVPHPRTGKKVALIAELQSQAAQARRDQMKSLKNSIAQIEERVNRGSLDRATADKLIQSQKDAADAEAPDHPVLPVHQSLGLKAVIKWVKEQNQKAIAEGRPEDVIGKVGISDGETAMMPVGPGYVQPVWTQLKWLRVKGKSAGQAYKVVTGLGQNARQDRANSAASPVFIQGNIASGATDAGNPVKVGGKYNSTLPTLSDGQRGDIQQDSRGGVIAVIKGSGTSNAAAVGSSADASSNQQALYVASRPELYNGSTFDRVRTNVDQTVGITASGVTTTQTGADQTNYNGRGAVVVLDMTTVGTGSVTLSVQGKDVASGKYYTIITGAAVVTNSTNVYRIYPGLTAVANTTVSDILPRTWRVVVTANNANATTYTVGASVIY